MGNLRLPRFNNPVGPGLALVKGYKTRKTIPCWIVSVVSILLPENVASSPDSSPKVKHRHHGKAWPSSQEIDQ